MDVTSLYYSNTDPMATSAPPPFKVGSAEHRKSLCGVLLDTFDPYKPAILAWPNLTADAERRLTSLPFWDVALETEGYASMRMQAFADTVRDPLLKAALSLNAFEEGRHKLVIRNMLQFYRIPLKVEGSYQPPRYPMWMFIRTGYGECFDSFFAFGLFKMAKDSGYFPPELVNVFEPVVQEEARHIMFFVNWIAYTAAQKSWHSRLYFRSQCFLALLLAVASRLILTIHADQGGSRDNFVMAGGADLTVGLTPRRLLTVALAEDKRRMRMYDPRLLRPWIIPFLAKLALYFLPKEANLSETHDA